VAYRDWRASCVRHPLSAWVNAVSAADATALPIPHRIIFEAGTLAQQLVMSDPFSFRRLPERRASFSPSSFSKARRCAALH
jgi:hypothetical protein